MKKKLIIFVTFILFFTSCIKEDDKPCPDDFVVYGEVLPYAETYKVGDTITLQAIYSNMIYELKTKKYYDMKDLNIEAIFTIYNIDTSYNVIHHGVNEFVNIIPNNIYNYYIQNFSSGSSSLFSNIIFKNNTFTHKLKIVLKKKGLFKIVYGPFTIENRQYFEGKCKGYFNLNTRLNKGKDNNIDLLKESPNEHFNTWVFINPEERFYRGGFAYRVVK